MDELVKLVSQKTGISEDQARMAAQTVVNFLKEKLPAPIAAQIDTVINNPGLAQGLSQGLGGLFGGRQ